jgi:hypothetical protein
MANCLIKYSDVQYFGVIYLLIEHTTTILLQKDTFWKNLCLQPYGSSFDIS